MKKETLADRLNLAMEQSGMSQGALAKASGVAQPTIWRLTSGNARGSTKIVEIANALGVRTEWLSSGIGPMRNDGQQLGKPTANHPKYFKIDVLDIEVSAGPGVINREFVEVLRSVEYSFDDARHMFDGRKAENIRIINVAVTACQERSNQVICCSLISQLNLSTVMVSMRFCTTTQPM